MDDETTFTADEEAQFTLLNCVAFDKVRLDDKAAGVIPPMWLCMSEEAREAAIDWYEKTPVTVNGKATTVKDYTYDFLNKERALKSVA